MKTRMILLSMVLALFASCEKETLGTTPDVQSTQQVQNVEERTAVEALVSLLGENPAYFDYINARVCSDDVEYMEDRVLFRDLFQSPATGLLSKSVDGSFASDFARHIGGRQAMLRSEAEDNGIDADALMGYLAERNISIYCPFPLEDYAEDNRIPAICSIVSDNLDSLPGVQYHADGTYEDVIVSQAYAENHPVWIVRQEGDYIFDEANTRKEEQANVSDRSITIRKAHYESSIVSLYCLNYYGGIGEGDLQLHIGTVSKTPVNISTPASPLYCGAFDQFECHYVPRKYVGWAKKGYDKGWFVINQIFDDDWTENRMQHYVLLYEYDPKSSTKVEHSFGTKFQYKGASAEYNAKISYTTTKDSDIIGTRRWSRAWFMDVEKNGDKATVWNSSEGGAKDRYAGQYYLTRMGEVIMAINSRTYYTTEVVDTPDDNNPPFKPIDPDTHPGVVIP